MIQQAYKYVSSSLWPCLAFFGLKITNILKSSGWGLKQSELPLDCSQSPIFPCDRRCRCGSLNASETGERTKCPWVGVVEGTAGGKNRETVTASLCLVFKGRGRSLAPPLIKSINNLFPGENAFKSVSVAHEIDSMQFNTKLSRINAGRKIS